MKKVILKLCMVVILILGYSRKVSAQVMINSDNFPDPGFREYVYTTYDKNGDMSLSDDEIAHATEMNVYFCSDPEQRICLMLDEGETRRDVRGKDCNTKIAEFSCGELEEHPLSSAAYAYGNVDRSVLEHPEYHAYYLTGRQGWKKVINQPMTNWNGIEYLSNLYRVSIGGDLPANMEISNLTSIHHLTLAGADSTVKNVTIRNCPNLKTFYYQKSNCLTQINLSDVAGKLEAIGQRYDCDPVTGGGVWGNVKNVKNFVIGKAPELRKASIDASSKIKFNSLKHINELNLNINDISAVVDLSNSRELKQLNISGMHCKKIILPNTIFDLEYPQGGKCVIKEMDLRKIQKSNREMIEKIFQQILYDSKAYKKSTIRRLTINKKIFKSYKKTVSKLTRHNFIKVIKR